MSELWIKFRDAEGADQRIAVVGDRLTVGRHSENDLTIADGRLSREHVVIEREGGDYFVTDRGSSNGTELNGEKLFDRSQLNDGDRLDLGGFLVEIEVAVSEAAEPGPDELSPEPEIASPPMAAPVVAPASSEPGGIPTSFFIIAPIFAIVILALIGLVVVLSGGKDKNENGNFVFSGDPDSTPKGRKDKDPDINGSGTNQIVTSSPTPSDANGLSSPPPTPGSTESAKAEANAASFLRRIAQNDPKAFITGEQAQIVNSKIKSISGSPSLADNINSARKSSAQIKALAASKNLKPQFLATAAITKLGTARGDVLQAAQSMADILDRLGTQVGNEFAEDCLIMMAAYDQGAAGDFLKMRDMLQNLATKMPENTRAIRTIWFLKKNGKISNEQFDFALRFLATGAITQNPRDFGVNAEALTF